MRNAAHRLPMLMLLIAFVLIGAACTTTSGPSSGRPDTGLAPGPTRPLWTSPSPCIPEGAERTLNTEQFRAALAQEALTYITEIIPNFAEVIPGYPPDGKSGGTVQRDKDVAAAASLGDPSGVQRYVDDHCKSIPFVPAQPTPSSGFQQSIAASFIISKKVNIQRIAAS